MKSGVIKNKEKCKKLIMDMNQNTKRKNKFDMCNIIKGNEFEKEQSN